MASSEQGGDLHIEAGPSGIIKVEQDGVLIETLYPVSLTLVTIDRTGKATTAPMQLDDECVRRPEHFSHHVRHGYCLDCRGEV